MLGCHVTGANTKLLRQREGAMLNNPRRVLWVDTKYIFILYVFLIIQKLVKVELVNKATVIITMGFTDNLH